LGDALDNRFDSQLERLRKRAQEKRAEGWKPRQLKLRAMRHAFVNRRRQLQEALAADLNRPALETDLLEYLPTLGELDRAIANIRRWSKPGKVLTPLALIGARSEIVPQPKGLCLILSPWNYPASLSLAPLVSCIAAGNTAVLKPSEFTPATNGYLRELIADVFDADEVAVIEGGPEVAGGLLAQPFGHIFFTGSPQVGRLVMAAAAKQPVSVTLELGGKSPALVLKSANIADAARKIVWGKFVNSGQTCIAPDYVLVEEPIAGKLKEALAQRINEVYRVETTEGRPGNDYTAIVTARHTARLLEIIEDARKKGATILTGGKGDSTQRFVAPTLMSGITAEMRAGQEEIFGPILPVMPVKDLDAAIAHVNASPPPLASYIFSKDKAATGRFIAEAPAGGTCVNHTLIHFANEKLPFGGIGPSGIGRSHGKAGFESFSNMRAVMRDRVSPTRLFFPPYTGRGRALMSAFLTFMRG
jgi:aldehyde dehydrogenase (NAD+)